MDLITALIGLAVLAICALPFWAASRSRIRTENQFRKMLEGEASRHNCQPGAYGAGMSFALLVSACEKCVFFYELPDNKEGRLVSLPLNTVVRFSVMRGGHQASDGKNDYFVTDKVGILAHFKDTRQPSKTLLFYDSDRNIQSSNEILLAEKWEKYLNALIKK